ncbi:MAG: hypothetical protein K9J30_06145 [Bacteroidales bacterium]|nr:hypothetical protein [Bacteroidales bacterium]
MRKNNTIILAGMLLALAAGCYAQDGLFISEIADPADDYSGRFIELFNSGTEPIDFSVNTFYLSRQSNGGDSWGDVQLTGVVAAGETYVIGGSAFASLYGFLPDLETGILIGNGDDAYFLFYGGDHTGGTLYDIYGEINLDGTGTLWEYTDSRAVRVEGVTTANTTWLAAEWEIAAANISGCDPGVHHGAGGGDIPEPGVYSLGVTNDTADVGQIVEVTVEVGPLTVSDNIISYQFDINFDSTALAYSNYSITGTLAEGGTAEVNSSEADRLTFSYMNSQPLTGSGDILVIQFNTLNVIDTTQILLSDAWLNNTPVEDLLPGQVIIKEDIPPSSYIVYSDTANRYADTLVITATFNEPLDAAFPVLLDLSGAVSLAGLEMMRVNDTVYRYDYGIPIAEGMVTVSLHSGRDLYGNEIEMEPVYGKTFNIMPFRPGDVDDDGRILAYDAALTLQHSVGLDPLPVADPLPWEPWRDSTANVDGLSEITAYDAALILQYSAGIITSFETGVKKSAYAADVSIEMIGDELVFFSKGELIGLNVAVDEHKEMLGEPRILEEDFMKAVNTGDSFYRIGLCSSYSLPEGTAFMKIPIEGSGSISFRIRVNNEKRTVNMELSTEVTTISTDHIRVYPIPAKDYLFLVADAQSNMDINRIQIVDQIGRLLHETRMDGLFKIIDTSSFGGAGNCYLKAFDDRGNLLIARTIIIW